MKLYCKDFDEKKCKYENGQRCAWAITTPQGDSYYILYARICGKKHVEREYVTKFEYLMLKELEER